MAASISITDAVSITGATAGKAITEKEVVIIGLTSPQKTALAAFVATLGQWPGGSGNVLALSVFRTPTSAAQINCTVRGLIVYPTGPDALANMNARTEEFVGVVS